MVHEGFRSHVVVDNGTLKLEAVNYHDEQFRSFDKMNELCDLLFKDYKDRGFISISVEVSMEILEGERCSIKKSNVV